MAESSASTGRSSSRGATASSSSSASSVGTASGSFDSPLASSLLPAAASSSNLTARQELVLSNLVRVMAVISQHVAKQEEDRTTDFL